MISRIHVDINDLAGLIKDPEVNMNNEPNTYCDTWLYADNILLS